MWCPEDTLQKDVDQTTYLVSRRSPRAYKRQYSSNPFGEGTLETGTQVAHQLLVNGQGTILPTVEGIPSLVSAFSEEEYIKGITELKYNQLAGIDYVLVEQLNNLGPRAHKWLLPILSKCLTENKIPKLRLSSYLSQGKTRQFQRAIDLYPSHVIYTSYCSSQVRDLGVIFDRVLSLRQHVSYTSRACRFHLRNISRIRKYIPQDISIVLIKSLVMSRLDYSNGLLYGLPKCTVSGLQAVQNSAAHIVTQERLRDHDSMSHALMELHWLPDDKRIEYKLLLYTVPVFTKCRIGIFIKIEIFAPKDYKCERLQSLNIIKLINKKIKMAARPVLTYRLKRPTVSLTK